MTSAYLRPDLQRDEGLQLFPYKDTTGNWTIGTGHNIETDHALLASLDDLQKYGITQAESDILLDADIATAVSGLQNALSWFTSLPPLRQDVLANMNFNLGLHGLLTFHNTLTFIEEGKYAAAAQNMLASKWSRQVGNRAVRLSRQLASGIHQSLPA